MVHYNISHLTLYRYSEPVTASMMEVRMHPLEDEYQNVVRFKLDLSPSARVQRYQDYLGNTIHLFDIPGQHDRLAIKADTTVEIANMPGLPSALLPEAWQVLEDQDFPRAAYDMLKPSHFARNSEIFEQFCREVGFQRLEDPLSTLIDINTRLYDSLAYDQTVTTVDSPIEVAIENRRGVCQDYAHIMLTVVRAMGIPCRYVSGYLFHRSEADDRSAEDASHAWVEAWLPELGWVGFDPTNNLICAERHIRACIGQDYAHSAPTMGVFTGTAETELSVSVQVSRRVEEPEDAQPTFSFQLPNYEHQHFQQQQQQQ